MKTRVIDLSGWQIKQEFNEDVTWTWAIAYENEEGFTTTRVHKGSETYDQARRSMNSTLRRFEKRGIAASGRLIEVL